MNRNETYEETAVKIVCFQLFPEPKERAHSSPFFWVLLFCLFFISIFVLAFPLFFSLVSTYQLSQRFGAE